MEDVLDGVIHHGGGGLEFFLVTPNEELLSYLFVLTQFFLNNAVEYQALILELEMAVNMKQLELQIF